MRLSLLCTAAIASLSASPVWGTPTLQISTVADIGLSLLNRPVHRMKYENLNHLISRMTNAVESLDKAISKAISSGKIQDSLAPAEKGLGLLAMYLADTTEGLNNGSVKINNPKQVYQNLIELKDAIKPVADKTSSLKINLDQLEFTDIIITVLQSLTYAFDGFYHALDSKLDKTDVPDCIALPILNSICTLDGAIYTLDSSAALTDDNFCITPNNLQCPSWQQLPNKVPALEKAHWDIRIYLLLIYQQKCFDQKHSQCQWNLVEAFLLIIYSQEPAWNCDKQLKQRKLISN